MSLVSVVIPCYDYGHFLEESVNSALQDQDRVDVRVLLVDDRSIDDTAAVAKCIAASDDRVKVVVHPENRAGAITCKHGLMEWATGNYCMVLAADDKLTPGSLRCAADLIDAHLNVGFACGNPINFRQDSPMPWARTKVRVWSAFPGHAWIERSFRVATGCITRIVHASDVEMWMRGAANADVGYARGVDQSSFSIQENNFSRNRPDLTDHSLRKLAYDAILERYRSARPYGGRLADTVHRKLAWEALRFAARADDRARVSPPAGDDLAAFRVDCRPAAEEMAAYRGLRLRQRIGRAAMPCLRPLMLTAAVRKAQNWWWRRPWERHGV